MNALQRGILVMLFLVNAGTSRAIADNAVYIDQVGSGVDIDITQDGSGNKIGANGTDNTKMKVDGDNTTLSIDTVGDTNKVLGNIVGTTDMDLDIDGDTNTVNIDIDSTDTYGADNGDYVIDLDGNNNAINLNVGTADQATGADVDWIVDGDYNSVTADIDINNATNAIDFLGSNVTIDYDGDGYDGHSVTIDGVGTTNYWDITVDQQSTLQADSVEIEIEGSGTSTTDNTVCISQSDSGTATGCQ
jgi:hypothetical protein